MKNDLVAAYLKERFAQQLHEGKWKAAVGKGARIMWVST